MKKMTALFLCLVLNIQISAAGFAAGTLVYTDHGYKAIEDLKTGDQIFCYDCAQNTATKESIVQVHKITDQKCMCITTQGGVLVLACNQRIYVPAKKQWFRADALLKNSELLALFEKDFKIESIMELDEKSDVYTLSVDCHHNFFVTKDHVLVHNTPVFVPVAIISFGEALVACITDTAVTAGVVWVGSKIINFLNGDDDDAKDKSDPDDNPTGLSSSGGGSAPDPEDPKKKELYERLINGKVIKKIRLDLGRVLEHMMKDKHDLKKLGQDKMEVFERIISEILRADSLGGIKEGPTQILTMLEGYPIEIRCFVQNGVLIMANAFASNFNRIYPNCFRSK